MSRQIKFRAWDKNLEDYADVFVIDFKNRSAICEHSEFGISTPIDLDNLILEQFTGVKDAYGEEIYEGDVVHGYDQEPDRDDGYIGSSVIEVVNFKWGSFWLGDFKNRIMLYTPPIIEVIGNVHTNPELLEAENE